MTNAQKLTMLDIPAPLSEDECADLCAAYPELTLENRSRYFANYSPSSYALLKNLLDNGVGSGVVSSYLDWSMVYVNHDAALHNLTHLFLQCNEEYTIVNRAIIRDLLSELRRILGAEHLDDSGRILTAEGVEGFLAVLWFTIETRSEESIPLTEEGIENQLVRDDLRNLVRDNPVRLEEIINCIRERGFSTVNDIEICLAEANTPVQSGWL